MKIDPLNFENPVVILGKKPVEASPDILLMMISSANSTPLVYMKSCSIKMRMKNGTMSFDALEQTKFTCQKGWHHYPGWVKKKSVLFIDKLPSFGRRRAERKGNHYERPC